ncbi:MAG TPA: glycosyltransferase [Planctomycetota bacterium]|nr:glycosyltransferase [Planctomycetota bacterium]
MSEPVTELSIILPAINEADNLSVLLPRLHEAGKSIGTYEIIVLDGGSTDDTAARSTMHGAKVHFQKERGYGMALKEAFEVARGKYIVTMDADYSHDPSFIRDLYAQREKYSVVVASRYAPGGSSDVSGLRSVLSRILNTVFRRVLAIPIRDMSSGYRLYRRSALQEIRITRRNFDALEEILIKLVGMGHGVVEVPFTYKARGAGVSKARVFKFGVQLAKTLYSLWQLRNGCDWCDYDHRAYDSKHFLQRYWQRTRHDLIMDWHRPARRVLDVGCGSSRILESVPGMIGLDVSFPKLRFMARRGCPVLRGSIYTLPFPDGAFDEVIFSQVIEHIPPKPQIMGEIRRVLRPGGRLIIGTPDYDRMFWVILEMFYSALKPEAYAHEHIAHYTLRSMRQLLADNGFEHLRSRYVGGGELVQLAIRR